MRCFARSLARFASVAVPRCRVYLAHDPHTRLLESFPSFTLFLLCAALASLPSRRPSRLLDRLSHFSKAVAPFFFSFFFSFASLSLRAFIRSLSALLSTCLSACACIALRVGWCGDTTPRLTAVPVVQRPVVSLLPPDSPTLTCAPFQSLCCHIAAYVFSSRLCDCTPLTCDPAPPPSACRSAEPPLAAPPP